uniref:BLOC-1-related complex subunit 6 C-terminal helix domain-containing protein n=1 Tax=Clytia hemisphaerica TaxID=252671 RepID=A0A7M5XG38_9CNID
MAKPRSSSPVSYISSSSEDDIQLNDKNTPTQAQQTLKSQITSVDPMVLPEIEEQAKIASKSIDRLMKFLSKELTEGTKATTDIVSVYDGTIDHVHSEVEQNIKAMYGLIAKCEELDRKMKPINELASQVRNIRETLDQLENICK